MGALDCHALVDGRIIIYHRASNIERRFTLNKFKRVVTFFLEYYREGSTDLSPIVTTFPVNEEDFQKRPKGTTNKIILALAPYRKELYRFVKANNLFTIIRPNHWDGVFKWINQRIDQLRARGRWAEKAALGWKVDGFFEKIRQAQNFTELKATYKEFKTEYLKMVQLIRQIVCPVVKAYFVNQGIYSDYMKCFYCPFRVFHYRPANIKIRDEFIDAEDKDEATMRARIKAFIGVIEPITNLHKVLKASQYLDWETLKQQESLLKQYEEETEKAIYGEPEP